MKSRLLYYFNTSPLFVSCIMLFIEKFWWKAPWCHCLCCCMSVEGVFKDVTHLPFFTGGLVYSMPLAFPYPLLGQVSCRRSSPPDDKPFVVQWDTTWYHFVIFFSLLTSVEKNWIDTWRSEWEEVSMFWLVSQGDEVLEVNLCHQEMTMFQGPLDKMQLSCWPIWLCFYPHDEGVLQGLRYIKMVVWLPGHHVTAFQIFVWQLAKFKLKY